MDIGKDLAKAYDDGYEQGKKGAVKWISVKDRLPEVGERVLVGMSNHHVTIGYYVSNFFGDTNGFKVSYGFVDTNYATHWMPLPEPPEGV